MGFVLKKIISAFLRPIFVLLVGSILGLVLSSRRTKAGVSPILIFAISLLLILSLNPVADSLLRPLESRYPPFVVSDQERPAIHWIVVLGGGHDPDPRFPLTSQVSQSTLARVVEAIQIQRQEPQSRLLFSGGAVFTSVPEAKTMADLALGLGVPEEKIARETKSQDTADQARAVAEFVESEPFVLVTSAAHMPRAMLLFEKQGLHPIAAPTQHLCKDKPYGIFDFLPSASAWLKIETAWHESLGLLWSRLQ